MTVYEIRVKEQLGQHWSAWFGGLTVTNEANDRVFLASNNGLLLCLRDRLRVTPEFLQRPPEAKKAGAEEPKAEPPMPKFDVPPKKEPEPKLSHGEDSIEPLIGRLCWCMQHSFEGWIAAATNLKNEQTSMHSQSSMESCKGASKL